MLASQYLNYGLRQALVAIFLSINSTLIIGCCALAQIVPDRTLNTQVNLIDGKKTITGGIESGTNLFHSFQEFSPTRNFEIHFDNNNYIKSIFTRITGSSPSLIDSLIKNNGNADLFIMNPAGIIFGENAQLQIGGSFITTTAESIIFDDGTKFNAQINQSSPLLTISIPSGLQFGSSPGSISTKIQLQPTTPEAIINLEVPTNKSIAILGGNISLQSTSLEALSGRVDVASIAENEIVSLLPSSFGWEFDYESVGKFGDIKISQFSQINTSGEFGITNLRGRDINLNSGAEIFNSLTSPNTNVSGGDININATSNIHLEEASLSTEVAGFDAEQNPLPHPVTGAGGDIVIEAENLKIRNGSVIVATSLSIGNGGDIILNSDESIELSGAKNNSPSQITTSLVDSGNGGSIIVNTGKLTVTDGGRIDSSSFGLGTAGDIFVNADESILISGNSSNFSTFLERQITFNSGFFASSGSENFSIPLLGQSGKITVVTPSLSIDKGGQISVSNLGEQNAGDININTEELLLQDNSQIISARASGNEGSITLSSNETILKDESTIATTATGTGTGGNIIFKADNIVLFEESTINADAHGGDGGRIIITTQSLLTQKNPEDVITASSQLGIDGEVTINIPDTNSKFETTQVRINTLAGEESIYTGCSLGTDFSANKFSYVGRGGMRKGPFDSQDSQEFIADLGIEDLNNQAIELNTNHNLENKEVEKSSKAITEATTWMINDNGNIELIAQASNNALSAECLFN